MKQASLRGKSTRKYFKNIARTFLHSAPLQHLLFEKINRHDRSMPFSSEASSDLSDARHYEQFTRHSTHFSSRNFI